VRYLAGAYRAANGDHNRAVAYYASGYYEAAKRRRHQHIRQADKDAADASAEPVPRP
jgi:hypothetical protein